MHSRKYLEILIYKCHDCLLGNDNRFKIFMDLSKCLLDFKGFWRIVVEVDVSQLKLVNLISSGWFWWIVIILISLRSLNKFQQLSDVEDYYRFWLVVICIDTCQFILVDSDDKSHSFFFLMNFNS